jgi:hypothetical protein
MLVKKKKEEKRENYKKKVKVKGKMIIWQVLTKNKNRNVKLSTKN